MLGFLHRAFGVISVTTKDGIITVKGISPLTIQNDIERLWRTSRIQMWMFNRIGKHEFSFNAFFALDLVYTLETMLADRRTKSNRRVLRNIVKALREHTWLAHIDKPAPKRLNRSALSQFKKTPMDKQAEFFDIYEKTVGPYSLNGMLLAAAAGSGKTITSLMLSEMLEADQTIAVVPINAIDTVWGKTLEGEMHHVPTYWLSNSGKPMKGTERYLIVHYEALGNFMLQLHRLKRNRKFVILDESHNFNELESQRTELFEQMCRQLQVPDVLPMSGTPIKALGSEAIPLFRVLDPLFTADTEFRFKKIFGISSTKGADILKARLGIFSYIVEKKDLPIEDPDIQQKLVKIPNGHEFTADAIKAKMVKFIDERLAYYATRKHADEQYFYGILKAHEKSLDTPSKKTAYRDYRTQLDFVIASRGDARICSAEIKLCNSYENKQILPQLDRENLVKFKDIRSIVKYVLLKVRGECLGRVVGKERMRVHLEMVKYIDFDPFFDSSEKKTVIFTSFVEVLEELVTRLTHQGHEVVSVYGKTNALLSATLDRFEKEEDVNPLVATYKSLSTAVPLLMADVQVLIDAPFRDYQLQQTISRTSRLGAYTPTTVYMMQLDTGNEPNISTRSFDILEWSQKQVAAITGVESPFALSEDMDKNELALEGLDEDQPPEGEINLRPSYMDW